MENPTLYTMQLRFVVNQSDGFCGNSELEVVAHPLPHAEQRSQPFLGRFQDWQPVFEDICCLMQSSPFHRKAIQRTLSAGLAAELINRETGSKHTFSADELTRLSLVPMLPPPSADLSTAA